MLVCNHVSFVDALLIGGGGAAAGALRHVLQDLQPAGARFVFRTAGTPIAGRNEDPEVFEQAFARIAEYLAAGELVHLPRGQVDHHGRDRRVQGRGRAHPRRQPGAGDLAGAARAVGQFLQSGAAQGLFRRFWSRVNIVAGTPLPADTGRLVMQEQVSLLRGDQR